MLTRQTLNKGKVDWQFEQFPDRLACMFSPYAKVRVAQAVCCQVWLAESWERTSRVIVKLLKQLHPRKEREVPVISSDDGN